MPDLETICDELTLQEGTVTTILALLRQGSAAGALRAIDELIAELTSISIALCDED